MKLGYRRWIILISWEAETRLAKQPLVMLTSAINKFPKADRVEGISLRPEALGHK